MSTLVDRYLRAVKEQLPRAQQDDVIAELTENLRAQIEDAEARSAGPSPTTRRPPSSSDSATRWWSRPAIAVTRARSASGGSSSARSCSPRTSRS